MDEIEHQLGKEIDCLALIFILHSRCFHHYNSANKQHHLAHRSHHHC